MFATFEHGLRLDASANGVQMGRSVPHTSGPLRIELDIDRVETFAGLDQKFLEQVVHSPAAFARRRCWPPDQSRPEQTCSVASRRLLSIAHRIARPAINDSLTGLAAPRVKDLLTAIARLPPGRGAVALSEGFGADIGCGEASLPASAEVCQRPLRIPQKA